MLKLISECHLFMIGMRFELSIMALRKLRSLNNMQNLAIIIIWLKNSPGHIGILALYWPFKNVTFRAPSMQVILKDTDFCDGSRPQSFSHLKDCQNLCMKL